MTNEQLPITKKEAMALGCRFYLNPETPCNTHGLQPRYASNRKCVKCAQANARRKAKTVNPVRYAAGQKRVTELAALRRQHGAKTEFDFLEPLTVSERALVATLFYQLLRFQVAARLGHELVEIHERNRTAALNQHGLQTTQQTAGI